MQLHTHTLCSSSPAWASLNEQAERVSGETEGPQRQPGKSEPDLPGERERQTGFISLFLIPLTRSTGPTVVLCAGFMYSQGKNNNKTKNRGFRVRKNLSINFCSFSLWQCLSRFPVFGAKKNNVSQYLTGFWLRNCMRLALLFRLKMPFCYRPSIQFDIGCLLSCFLFGREFIFALTNHYNWSVHVFNVNAESVSLNTLC